MNEVVLGDRGEIAGDSRAWKSIAFVMHSASRLAEGNLRVPAGEDT